MGKKRENQNNVEIWGWDCETIIFDYDEQKHINKYDVYCIAFYNIATGENKVFWGRQVLSELIIWLNEFVFS